MRNEHREGAFFVHKTLSVIVPYVLLVRSGGTVHEHLIVSAQRPAPAFTLNGITAPVLYKLVHYFMENPIMDSTVLKYAVPDPDVSHTHPMLMLNLLFLVCLFQQCY